MKSIKKTIGAIVLLGTGVAVFSQSIFKQMGGPESVVINDDNSSLDEIDDENQESTEIEYSGIDLLALYGSHKVGHTVPERLIYCPTTISVNDTQSVKPNVGELSAAPLGETAQQSNGNKVTFIPIELLVSMTMCTEKVSRAVINGQVIGIGERVPGGQVNLITQEGVQVQIGQRVLFYEINNPTPRGYTKPEVTDDSKSHAQGKEQ